MNEPFFPLTGKRVIPISEIQDDEVTVVRPPKRWRRNPLRGTTRNARIVRNVLLIVASSLVTMLLHSDSTKVVTQKDAEVLDGQKYEILPASLIRANPYPKYSITLPSGRWVDTRILVRPSQEIWI